ncbi:TrkH family potassium uptake protein [Massilia sp. GCM10020059]|uniref:TrkH family potassium uptake protein n=1 Tax=Massilia agrisoli TaxID=2892444 RepID=A0ABS8ISY4_9BURK|nr:TrkH family potassium uptake protein [Massilia agrisoli]MCC6071777.1 TrkH family potassium uptake protein [Massilia agrisoli]
MRQAPGASLAGLVEKRVRSLTPPQALLLSFIGLALAGALLLKLPIASHHGTSWTQALFTAVSASTVTGLVVVDTGTHFTLFGQSVLLVLMQAGGLGVMTFGMFIIYLMRDRMSLGHRAAVSEALNQPGQEDMRHLLRMMFGFTAIMEIAGTLLLAIQWVPDMGWQRGLFHSLFHAVSAFNNAGFALRADSLVAYAGNPLVNLVISLLFISGGLGFVVVADLIRKRRFRDYALHTKVMLVGTLVLNLVAMLAVLALEYGNPATLGQLPGAADKLWAAWFHGAVPRSAGFNTLDVASLQPATALLTMALMFIGGGSGSTAGGIKLGTFIVLVLATRSFLRADHQPVIFGRSLDSTVILRALAIATISVFGAMIGTFLLAITEQGAFLDIAFEAVSAFATSGLSRGLTPNLSVPGQALVMLMMMVGRVGPLTLAFLLATRRSAAIQYPSGRINIG